MIILSPVIVFASPAKNKIKKKIHQAENYFDKGDYYHAMLIFDELLELDPTSKYYNYHSGVCKYQLLHYRKDALQYLEKSDASVDTEIYYYQGMLYHLNCNYDKAIESFQKYLSLEVRVYDDIYVKQLIENVTTARNAYSHPAMVELINLGENINSTYSEYVPLITADGNRLFFTSRRPGSTGNKTDVLGNFYEDIYFIEKKDQVWSEIKQLPVPVNSESHDACVGLTPEGENLLIFRTNATLTSGDIYMTESDGTTWTSPHILDVIINDPNSNEPSACFSPDGEKIYFSSNRPGGYGGKDIYRCTKLPNGKWSLPVNLGPEINTVFDEDAPFVHANGKELYFSSKGHANIGGYDVFKSLMDSTGKWSKAMNMGYPINTVDDDIYLVLTAEGSYGYLSSSRNGGFGETDLYSFAFTTMDPGYTVREGFVKNTKGEPILAKITVIETDIMKIHGVYKSNRLTGKFIYLFCEDHDYEVVVEAEGYFSKTIYSGDFSLDKLEVELQSIKE